MGSCRIWSREKRRDCAAMVVVYHEFWDKDCGGCSAQFFIGRLT